MQSEVGQDQRNALIEQYRRYAEVIAIRMIRYMNLPTSSQEEFVAAGYLGLVEAADRFNPNGGSSFKTFAFLRIRGSIIDSIRQSSQLSSKAYRYAKAMQSAQDLREEIFSCGTDSKLQPRVSDAKEKLARILDYLAKGVVAFKLSVADPEKEMAAIADSAQNPEEALLSEENSIKMRELVETLPEKERNIVVQHYFYGKSFIEIAREQDGMSKSWVSKLHSRALSRLQEALIQPSDHCADTTAN